MLDLKWVRENPGLLREAITKKREFAALTALDELLGLDQQYRESLAELEALRAEHKKTSRAVAGSPNPELLEAARTMAAEIKSKEQRVRELSERVGALLLELPNPPLEDVPAGAGPEDNQVIATWGELPQFGFEPLPHWEVAEKLGLVDFGKGAAISGSGFPVFLGKGAALARTLIGYFLDFHAAAGFTEVAPPLLVNRESALGTAQLPDKEGQMYVVQDGLYLIPTAETPLTNLHRGEILPASALPVRYVAYTPCFRREAGSYGKDVRGLNRLHQFDKVEMVVLSKPEDSPAELEALTARAEALLRSLGLTYRKLFMCTGDMGFAQAKKYDLEVYAAGQKRWLEVSSISSFGDFQARRLQTRYRDGEGKPKLVHTLNGSGLALPRVIAAILENFQDSEGHVHLPPVLAERMGQEVL